MSPWQEVTTGLPQGSPLSPVCFNAYTCALASLETPANTRVLTFADDITVVAWGAEPSQAAQSAQNIVSGIQEVCDGLQMQINPRKASATLFTKRKIFGTPDAIAYDGVPIPYLDSLRLLGIVLDRGLSFAEHIEVLRQRCVRILPTLKAAFARGVDTQRLTRLYRSLILSRITYGIEIISPSKASIEKLERIQNSCLRVISGCPRATSIMALQHVFDMKPIADVHEALRAKAICVIASDADHPLHASVDEYLRRPPLARLTRQGWLRGASSLVRSVCGRHTVRRAPSWKPTPADVRSRWDFHLDCFDRSARDLPNGVANGLFEELLSELASKQTQQCAILATDGSVLVSEPRTGWGCVLRDEEGGLLTTRGACKLRLSSMRAETEAVTKGLELLQSACDAPVVIICSDSLSLLKKLQTGSSPPEWHSIDRQIIWLYCPGHAGISLNERADQLAGSAPATDHILLDPRDVKSAVDHMQRVRGEAREQNSEMQRMRDHHLERGWAARSLAGGWGAQLMCQLATGTVTASSLRRVLLMGGAETAWDRLIGPRQSRKPPDLQ